MRRIVATLACIGFLLAACAPSSDAGATAYRLTGERFTLRTTGGGDRLLINSFAPANGNAVSPAYVLEGHDLYRLPIASDEERVKIDGICNALAASCVIEPMVFVGANLIVREVAGLFDRTLGGYFVILPDAKEAVLLYDGSAYSAQVSSEQDVLDAALLALRLRDTASTNAGFDDGTANNSPSLIAWYGNSFSVTAPAGEYLPYRAHGGLYTYTLDGSRPTLSVPEQESTLRDLFATESGLYGIEQLPAGDYALVKYQPTGSGAREVWRTPITRERYGVATRCVRGKLGSGAIATKERTTCATFEHNGLLYISYQSGEIVTYSAVTGAEQTSPAPCQLPDLTVATGFLLDTNGEIAAVTERVGGWAFASLRDGAWVLDASPLPESELRSPLFPPVLGTVGSPRFAAAIDPSYDPQLGLLGITTGTERAVTWITYGNDGYRTRIVPNPEIGVRVAPNGDGSGAFTVDAEGRLFSLSATTATLIESEGPVVDLVLIGETIFAGVQESDDRVSYRALERGE